jgi:hypothetical protein
MSSQIESMAASKRLRDEARRREANVFSILTQDFSDVQLAQLVVQQQVFLLEAQSECHNDANNPGKGVGNSNLKYRLLQFVLRRESGFPMSLRDWLHVDPAASFNQKGSRTQQAMRLWDAVHKLSCRLSAVVKCLERGMLLEMRF